VKVENITHPATVKWVAGDVLQLVMGIGINDVGLNDQSLTIFPNPMQGMAEISFFAKQSGKASVSIFDIAGKLIIQTESKLIQGTQKVQLTGLKQGMYIISIKGDNYLYTAKILSQNAATGEAAIKYMGNSNSGDAISTDKSTKTTISMPYVAGDSLVFTGYAADLTSIVKDVPTASKTITFTFVAPFISTVNIPGGTFTMGSPISEEEHATDETQFQVTLSAFKMSKYEITNAQMAVFLNADSIESDGYNSEGPFPFINYVSESAAPYDWGLHYNGTDWVPAAGYENFPAINVTYAGAYGFAANYGGRLPTEAEWEYACRANTTTPFNTGDCLNETEANFKWTIPYSTCSVFTSYPDSTQAVGSYPANAFGLYDMHGNVWEWCSDYYGVYPTSPQTNPTGPTTGTSYVYRGGGWMDGKRFCRSAVRKSYFVYTGIIEIGFRVVMP
jgi:formylglycine-generating enzyme required for sulfatase activity